MSDDLDELTNALVAFQADMPVVGKTKTARVPTKAGGEYTYTYADLAVVQAAAMPLLVKHGLAFSVTPRGTEQGFVIEGHLLHSSGQSLSAALPLHGRTAQEIGSSLTYARRYLLGCLTGIVTDDDDDAQVANEARRAQQPMTARTQRELVALFERKGIAEADRLAGVNRATGGQYADLDEVTEAHAQQVVQMLRQRPDAAGEPSGAPSATAGHTDGEEAPRPVSASSPSPDTPGDVDAGSTPPGRPSTSSGATTTDRVRAPATKAQLRMLFARLKELGVDDDTERKFIASKIVGRTVESFSHLSLADVSKVIDTLAGFRTNADLWGYLDSLDQDALPVSVEEG